MDDERSVPLDAAEWHPSGEKFHSDEHATSPLDEYEPSPEQLERFAVLRTLCETCDAASIKISITGGYGLDGLYGTLTRDHDDIDVLVEGGKKLQFAEILSSIGFIHDTTITARETYYLPHLDFKIEWDSIERLPEVTNEPAEMFMPTEPNAQLYGTEFRTPTLAGHLLSIQLLTKRAKELGWSAYPPEKGDNKQRLLEALQKRQTA